MNTWEKVFVGAGACLLAGAVGYCAYKYYKTKTNEASKNKEDENVWESGSDDGNKVPLLNLMDYVLIDGISFMWRMVDEVQEYKNTYQSSPEVEAQLRESVGKVFADVEARTCIENGWDFNDYLAEVEARQEAKDPEVLQRIATVDRIIQETLSGRRAQIVFSVDPKFTPEVTSTLFAWITLVHGYTQYKEVRKHIARGKLVNAELLEIVEKDVEKTKNERR
eukprot:TRINITY_DN7842_c0_g2_i4.p1 TRINITY_DN7842_c0_g2~~TRINITY_DN7842_c0_g2_i4.p1  ORF type:complete len:222 (+),score=80.01 TRINITY_DN7842_c0_g2_i4:215-880(+)